MDGKVTVAYDGDCLMCSRGIRFLAEHDPHRRFEFVKLQSARGRRMEEQAGTGALQTLLAGADDRVYARSAAVLRCARAMGGIWKVLGLLGYCFPFRDALYNWIARHRQQWFRHTVCEMPSPALRERLADGDAEV